MLKYLRFTFKCYNEHGIIGFPPKRKKIKSIQSHLWSKRGDEICWEGRWDLLEWKMWHMACQFFIKKQDLVIRNPTKLPLQPQSSNCCGSSCLMWKVNLSVCVILAMLIMTSAEKRNTLGERNTPHVFGKLFSLLPGWWKARI